MFSLPLAPAADDAMQDRDQVLGQGRKIDREGRRDSNMKTQQPPQIAGLLHRVVVQGDDFVLRVRDATSFQEQLGTASSTFCAPSAQASSGR